MTINGVRGKALYIHVGKLPGSVVLVIVITDVVVSGTATVVGGGGWGFMITFLVVEYVSVLVRVTGIVTGVELIVVVLYVTCETLLHVSYV